MDDVNMEDAGQVIVGHAAEPQAEQTSSAPTATTSATTLEQDVSTKQQPDTTDAITTSINPAASASHSPNQTENSNKETESSSPAVSEPASVSGSSTMNVDTMDKKNGQAGTTPEEQKNEDSAMDIDTVPPVESSSTGIDARAQDHHMDSQLAQETSSTRSQPAASADGAAATSGAQLAAAPGMSSGTNTESTLTTPAASAETVKLDGDGNPAPETAPTAAASSSSEPTTSTTAPTGEPVDPVITGAPSDSTMATAPESQPEPTAPAGPPPKPVYVPQFKFTTFAPMTPLPVRNITSTFQKTEKNFVLKEVAAGKQRRRKRKAAQTEDGTGETKQETDSQDNEAGGVGESGALKRKRGDEFSTTRRGIFPDEGDTEDEKENEEAEPKENDDEDDEDEFSSDSDSEESVMNEVDENGEARSSADMGKNIIIIHPGSRVLRIGRASDAYPIQTPHCIARRIRVPPPPAATTNGSAKTGTGAGATKGDEAVDVDQDKDQAMDVDEDEEGDSRNSPVPDVVNDRFLQEIEYDLKMRMKAAKRKPVNSAKTQVRSFNSSTRPERILDHNDPYKVEWTDPAAEGEYIIGQKALNLPPGKHNFKLFWPVVGGKLNETDYPTPRVVVSDMETIWTKVIHEDLGIESEKFRKHYALLIIPDHYSKVYVTELVGMMLKSMQFRGVMVQQESVCATFGAGVSAACVVDIGAEITKVSCVEDGICIPNSRAVLKYGGDDITRCFAALVKRTGFPYQELDLSLTYDWRLMEELKEKWCTMNEADLTVQVYSFFVRRPEKQTEKYQVKVYDEVALSPMCLFFPGVIRRWIEKREVKPSFTKLINYEDINEDAPPIALMNQTSKKSTAAAAAAAAAANAARAGTPSLTAPGEENAQASQAGTPNATPAQTPAPSAVATVSTPAPGVSTPAASAVASTVVVPATPAVIPFAMEPSVKTTDLAWEVAGTIGKDHFSSLVALDVVVAQCISNCGSEERSKKLYGSIILVGGGGMIQGFDRVLEDRLFQALPATLTTVEKVEVLPAPREMDPRLLVWKGGSVLGKLETARELWIKPLEWELLGRKVLRDKALFVWSSKD
ncbi:actin-like protein arp8 [Mortierella sp. GBA35]|nr:actin-like protein arp8 [Mortierella sp. GBA35]